MSFEINPLLMALAEKKMSEKRAFIPAGGGGAAPMDPAAGAAPMDPAMMAGGMGGAGGAPPMPPDMGGGMPPMDPGMGGGMPPMPPDMGGGMPPGEDVPPPPESAGGDAGGGDSKPKKPKIDPTYIYMELSRVRKLLTHFMRHTGIDLPPDILDDNLPQQLLGEQSEPESKPIGADPSEQAGEQEAGAEGFGSPGVAPGGIPEVATEKSSAQRALDVFKAPPTSGEYVSKAQKLSAVEKLLNSVAD